MSIKKTNQPPNLNPEVMTDRTRCELLRVQLENERATFLPHWREIAEVILPRRPRFNISDVNKGWRRDTRIVDSTGLMALRTLRSGMMSGVTSPARPWFRLITPDPGLAESGAVKEWLFEVTQRMQTVFSRSNLYNVLPIIYGDIGAFGTGAVLMEPDQHAVIRFFPFPIGSYCISVNKNLQVDTFFRDFTMTVRELVQKFGRQDETGKIDWSKFSIPVQTAWSRGLLETRINVCHVVMPNPEFNPQRIETQYKRFISIYYERGYTNNTVSISNQLVDDFEANLILSKKGYDYFPVLCPRWEVTGEDSYGTSCPGMDVLGDVKALQLMQKRKAQAIEKMVNPPLVGPSQLQSTRTSILPGDITYVDEREDSKGFRPIHEVQPRVAELLQDIQDHQQRIKRGFFEDLFLMMAESDRREITAREVDERHEEKLLALGPVLEQLNQDLLDPLIDNTFQMMFERRLIPPPPQEVQGQTLTVEYISIMAQAQQLIGISAIEKFTGFLTQTAQASQDPSILDNADMDELAQSYGAMVGVPPKGVRAPDEIQAIRDKRQKAQARQAQVEQMNQAADTAQKLGSTPTDGKNALTDLLQQAQAGQIAPVN